MKQTTDLKTAWLNNPKNRNIKIELDNLDWAKLVKNDDGNIVVENEHGTQFDIDQLSDDEINIFYDNLTEKETSISNDSLEFELRYSERGGYYFIDKIEAGEGYTIAKLEDEDEGDMEQLIFQANNYNALKDENEQLKQALQMFHDAFVHRDGEIVKNRVKTDIIRRCDEIKDALNNSHQLLTYGAK